MACTIDASRALPARRGLAAVIGMAAVLSSSAASGAPSPEQVAFFESKIRPVLAQHCYQCHSAEALRAGRLKAGLLVDSREGMHKGGESGAAVVPGSREESLLIKALKHDGFEMPPAGKLSDQIIADFEKWIDMGAPDPRDEPVAAVEERRIDSAKAREHWSYRRLAPVSPPAVKAAGWVRNDIDRFILAAQEQAGIVPAPEAAKATLARRVFFDLTGLPPSPEELKQFLDDTSDDAYEKLVDRLLASPRYGERWARHWLDTVRFGESGGYEFDADRPGAHHYRDWVIRALNADTPYDRFLRLQVAGDLVKPGDYDATSATGFLVAGPYPGQVTAKTVEPIRYDQLDDMVQALGSSVLGMTIGCARCHDHKYDAIGQRDYYAMLACLGKAVQKDTPIDLDPATTKKNRDAWLVEQTPRLAAFDRFRREELPGRIARWLASEAPRQLQPAAWVALDPQTVRGAKATLKEEPDDVVAATGKLEGNDAYTLTFRTHQRGLKAIRLETLSGTAPGGGIGTGKDGAFRLSKLTVSATPVVPGGDRKPVTPTLSAVAATSEVAGFELAKAVDADAKTGWSVGGQAVAPQAAVLAFDKPIGYEGGTQLTVELKFEDNQPGLARVRLAVSADDGATDLVSPAVPQAGRELAAVLDAGRDPTADAVSRELMAWLARIDADAARVTTELAAVNAKEPKPNLVNVYAAVNGRWVITGNSQGVQPGSEEVFFLARGEVNRKQGKAVPGFVLATLAADDAGEKLFSGADAKPADPRLGLANFLVDLPHGAGPLAARVIVNRLWHHHFGRGLVSTPNDFGTQGDPPTHPQLVEWLANRLVEGGWSLKGMHRLIVTAAAYRQSGQVTEAHRAKDPDNRLLWHRRPTRLEGESIRDALLAVAGRLDATMYGRAGLDVNVPRRSIYLNVKRSQPVGFLQVFDQPEPVQSVGARGTATVPTQALTMLNAPFVRSAAEALAKRARTSLGIAAAAPSGEAAIDWCFAATLSRQPTNDERQRFATLLASREQSAPAKEAALADVCHLLFCLNEFVYVD